MTMRESARGVIAAMVEARKEQWRAEARQFAHLVDFADCYREDPSSADGPMGERMVVWGGEGVPPVAEFCHLELAAARRQSAELTRIDLSHAQSIKYRFPQVWGLVMDGDLRVHRARDIANETDELTLLDAGELDALVAAWQRSMPWTRVMDMVRAFVMERLPIQAETREEFELSARGVEFRDNGNTLTRDVVATLDVADALFLKAQVQRLALILERGGVKGTMDNLRAKALGVLASPARALQLLQAACAEELPDLDVDCPAAGQRGHTCGTITVDPGRLLPRADLVVHLSQGTAMGEDGLARVEGLRPVLAERLADLLDSTQITVRPVRDFNDTVPVDAYECPDHMREAVVVRNAHEVFPFSQKQARRLDLDHTIPWRTGTRLTRPDNLGPLSRTVHRAKSVGGWTVHQVRPGVFWWESPLGFEYLVTPSHSVMISDPTRTMLPIRQTVERPLSRAA